MLLGTLTLRIDVRGNGPVIFDNTNRSIIVEYELFNELITAVTLYFIVLFVSLIPHIGMFTFSR